MPIFHKDVIQGSSAWIALRCGVPSASQFHRIITPKGAPSKSAEVYMCELIAEKITGVPADPYISTWMGRGSELEKEAVDFYTFMTGTETEPVGFITDDLNRYGASPDRLVGENGLLEIKVGKPSTHIGLLLKNGTAYEEHRIQTQGQLWIAEREWNDLEAYNPGLPPAIHRVEREEGFIRLLSGAVTAFCEVMEANYQMLQQRGIGFPHKPSPPPSLVDLLKESLQAIQKS